MNVNKKIALLEKRISKFAEIRKANAVQMYYTKDGKIAFRRAQ